MQRGWAECLDNEGAHASKAHVKLLLRLSSGHQPWDKGERKAKQRRGDTLFGPVPTQSMAPRTAAAPGRWSSSGAASPGPQSLASVAH